MGLYPIKSGLDCLCEQGFAPLRNLRIGLVTHPAAVDRAVQRLNQPELEELGRLLQTELKRSGN